MQKLTYTRCGDCEFWRISHGYNGRCKKNSAVPYINIRGDVASMWPSTFANDGCYSGQEKDGD